MACSVNSYPRIQHQRDQTRADLLRPSAASTANTSHLPHHSRSFTRYCRYSPDTCTRSTSGKHEKNTHVERTNYSRTAPRSPQQRNIDRELVSCSIKIQIRCRSTDAITLINNPKLYGIRRRTVHQDAVAGKRFCHLGLLTF